MGAPLRPLEVVDLRRLSSCPRRRIGAGTTIARPAILSRELCPTVVPPADSTRAAVPSAL
jgi:hypothetical protein